MIRPILKVFFFCILVSSYMLVSFTADLFIRDDSKKRRFFMKVTSFGSKLALKLFAIRVEIENKDELEKISKSCLVVSNHLSYLDILIISSHLPSLFITSVEVKKMFFLGFMSRMGGSLFIERRSKSKLLEEIDRVGSLIKSGFRVVLFPEGTSSNGDTVLPFKAALFSSATQSSSPLRPLCIKYRTVNGVPIDQTNRDLVYYYGGISFFPHLLKLFFVKSMSVTLSTLPAIETAMSERKELVTKAHFSICEKYLM